MIFLDEHSKSPIEKILMLLGVLLGSVIGALTVGDYSGSFLVVSIENIQGNYYRQVTMFACCMLYSLRFAIALFVFIQRKISWFETIVVTFLFFMMFYYFSFSAARTSQPFGIIDVLGVIIFLLGSYINFTADYQRFVWKKDTKNKGKLYTEGLFKYSMHMNYFGDAVAYLGLALITQNIGCIGIAVGMFVYFITYEIPRLDSHLSKKYTEFEDYSKNTKKFIPFIY